MEKNSNKIIQDQINPVKQINNYLDNLCIGQIVQAINYRETIETINYSNSYIKQIPETIETINDSNSVIKQIPETIETINDHNSVIKQIPESSETMNNSNLYIKQITGTIEKMTDPNSVTFSIVPKNIETMNNSNLHIKQIPDIIETINDSNSYPKQIYDININICSLKELSMLPGIGTKLARRIVNYRIYKKFNVISDIMNVPYIKNKRFDKIKHLIQV